MGDPDCSEAESAPLHGEEVVSMVISFPFPVSTNRLWAGGKGRVFLTPAYKKWKDAADVSFQQQRRHIGQPVKGRFTYHIALDEKKRANRDGDNFCKAVLDQLQRLELIENDKLADQGSWAWAPVEGCLVTVRKSLSERS